MHIAISVFVAVVGLLVGSFLNVVILRLHAGKQFAKGRSACPHCKHVLGAGELVPLVSWLVQRGRCRHCHKPISRQYPVVEALTAALFTLAYLTHPPDSLANLVVLILWLYVIASFIVLAVYDLRWYLLPDKVLLPAIVPAAAILLVEAIAAQSPAVAYRPLLAALFAGGGFYSLAAVSRGRWMGGGDIKLVFVIGLLLGIQKSAVALSLAFISAAVVGVVLILRQRKQRTDSIPFGPFLIAGTLAAYLWGAAIIHWYLGLSGLS
jgi:prepilin signal peptidase PulO-like enzyme (type II secretory pathway)